MPTLSKITLAFARYTNLTLGGGSAAAATLHRELVEKRQWLTDDQFTLSLALGRVTSGTNLFASVPALATCYAVCLAQSSRCSDRPSHVWFLLRHSRPSLRTGGPTTSRKLPFMARLLRRSASQ
jgi:hypothetical protein